MSEWIIDVVETGLYYWRCRGMGQNHVLLIQVSKYIMPNTAGHRIFHAEALLPVSGSAYEYKFTGKIEEMPEGEFWGPLPVPSH